MLPLLFAAISQHIFTPRVCPYFEAEFCLLTHVQGLINVIEKVLLHMVFFKI